MTLFDGIHLAHVTVLQQIKKTCVTELLLLGFLLYLREIPSISPRGLIFRGEIKWKGFRHYVFGGGGGGGGELYLEGLIHNGFMQAV